VSSANSDVNASVAEGLRLCREGQWHKGMPLLAFAIENRGPYEKLPGAVYSFLGYGVARYQGRAREGLKLCDHALKLEFYDPDNHWNRARTLALSGERMAVVTAVEHGLQLDPEHEGLLTLKQEVGIRRAPVLGFLDRRNLVNVVLGRLRHNLGQKND
jgi:hypothetical protein